MASLTVRKLPDEVLKALNARAKANGKTIEAEVCDILQAAVAPIAQIKFGTLLVKIGREAQLTDREISIFDCIRQKPRELDGTKNRT